MNKVFITGLALANDYVTCGPCNFDLEWIINHPSVFLWADKIIVTSAIWESIFEANFPSDMPELSKSIKLIFEIAKAENIIEIVSAKDIMLDSFSKYLQIQVAKDRQLLAETFPDIIKLVTEEDKSVPGGFTINGEEFCGLYVWQIYAGLFLSKALGAQCLFNRKSIEYCKYKFGLNYYNGAVSDTKFNANQKIFEAFIPNEPIIHHYAYDNKGKCLTCKHEKECSDIYLSNIEDNFYKIINWRNYDEIKQIRNTLNSIIDKRETYGDSMVTEDIIKEFQKKREKIRKIIFMLFPQVKRWANVTTLISTPAAIVGNLTGNPVVTSVAATMTGASVFTEKMIEMLSNKYRWVSFTSAGLKK